MSEANDRDRIRFQLCSRVSTCCPEVVIDGEYVTIEDDDGGRVKLTRDEFKQLLERSSKHLE